MTTKPFTKKDLARIARSNIVDFILEGINELEKDVKLNELEINIGLVWATPDRKIKINNLLMLLNILVSECANDPRTGKILIEAKPLLEVLKKLKATIDQKTTTEWLLGKKKLHPEEINNHLDNIIRELTSWKNDMEDKIAIPPGNSHTRDVYHPAFNKTYNHIPSSLGDDYKTNFFFEARVKELCPFITTILFHAYAEEQVSFQEERSFEELSRVDIDVDLTDDHEIEKADNIRGLRLHGENDDKNYPGSYIVLRGGHHRTRALYKKFLAGEIEGEKKILIQLVKSEDFPDKDWINKVRKEIKSRDKLREKFTDNSHHT